MRILHTSDWHLGMMCKNSVSYGEDQEFFLKQIFEIADTGRVDAILIAGDIFDKSIASIEAVEIYDRAMSYLCNELKIPVLIIAGNHDGAKRLASCSNILKNSGLYIAGALEKEPVIFSKEDTDIYMLPWISTDRVKSVYPDKADEIESMEDAYRIVLDDYRARFAENHKNILLSHAFIVNATTSTSDKAAEVGHATAVPASLFEGFDYVALGHIHGPQRIGENIIYCGSPMAYSFGREENQEKGVVIYDTDTKAVENVQLKPLHARKTLTGTYDELMNGKFDDCVLSGYVRLELTDSFVGLDTIAAFREKFPNLLEISGKSLEKEDAQITMTVDEFEDVSKDAKVVFERYCEDVLGEGASEHMRNLFEKALARFAKEVENS